MKPVLDARDVSVRYHLRGRRVLQAVDGVSLSVMPGEALALVGESGCGKSTLGRCLVRLQRPSSGAIAIDGIDIARMSERALRPYRRRMQMVFQDSQAALNPRRTVAASLAAPLLAQGVSRAEAAARVAKLLELVGLPEEAGSRFPHAFSGGQRQRINIARALALDPALVVADEPVAALDVSVQAQIINLFSDLRARLGLAMLFISHDLAVVRQLSDRMAVMYLGSVVEEGPTEALLRMPRHPYTAALMAAVPTRDGAAPAVLAGDVPSPLDPPSGCRFHTRCPFVRERCRSERPALVADVDGRTTACHFPIQS
ncbi:ABC transporter ATP-binding protein [Tanticharoenia sakaeratensis]|uniref:Oligopeptide transporter ATP-binding protein OppF n=1 Tax=Tanticharoenia sakaeratensis NBRC 103193 TaxID=1231623 RepID=A0A0D6MLH3_9PROT|nr:ABC transporter ATP-binding protein [Tanticharoenia sakaeratensis]GAN54163.1 oligopeptide transporter ATP-binding protein OppF [Tanticharoenia sakaeratensis NBRC 103193]GBQ19410.1 peptide ABC transporter ATP-binding protein [Tanticharoenia sakaeratensis NBRC 103193]